MLKILVFVIVLQLEVWVIEHKYIESYKLQLGFMYVYNIQQL